jgi:hypothetical protein
VRPNNSGSAEVVGECQVGQEGRAEQEEEGGGGRRKKTRGIGERRPGGGSCDRRYKK